MHALNEWTQPPKDLIPVRFAAGLPWTLPTSSKLVARISRCCIDKPWSHWTLCWLRPCGKEISPSAGDRSAPAYPWPHSSLSCAAGCPPRSPATPRRRPNLPSYVTRRAGFESLAATTWSTHLPAHQVPAAPRSAEIVRQVELCLCNDARLGRKKGNK